MTIKEHYNLIISIKEGKAELNGLQPYNDNGAAIMAELTSGSKVAVWRLWCWIMAFYSWLLAKDLEKHKLEVLDTISKHRHGSLPYYHQRSLGFQYGYALDWNGSQYGYLVADESSKVIKHCAIVRNAGLLIFKVASVDNAPLDSAQKSAYSDYLFDILYPGTFYEIISEDADKLKLDMEVYLNTQIINLDGEELNTGNALIELAVSNYIANLPFNGKMNVQHLIDAVQAVDGVKDVKMLSKSYRYGSTAWLAIDREVVPFSGHMVLSLSDSDINYLSYV